MVMISRIHSQIILTSSESNKKRQDFLEWARKKQLRHEFVELDLLALHDPQVAGDDGAVGRRWGEGRWLDDAGEAVAEISWRCGG